MLENGYIRLYRSLLNWEWYDDQNTKVLFLHLLLTVNYEPKVWHGISIDRGQRISSYAVLAEELNMSIKSVRTAINHLKQTGEVAHQTNAQYGLFTVVNYDRFQPRADDQALQTADSGQSDSMNKLLTHAENQKIGQSIGHTDVTEETEESCGLAKDVLLDAADQPAERGQSRGSQGAANGQQRKKAKKANKVKEDSIYVEIVSFLNEKAGTEYRPTSAKTRSLIDTRLNEKFTLDDFKTVITKKCAEWNHEPKDDQADMRPFLRPETLFGPKFEGYLNQKETVFKNYQTKQNKSAQTGDNSSIDMDKIHRLMHGGNYENL